jgi:hypothetical protein
MAAHVTWSEHKQKRIQFCKIVMCQFMHVRKIAKRLFARPHGAAQLHWADFD